MAIYPIMTGQGYTPDATYAFAMLAAFRLQQHIASNGKPICLNASTLDNPGCVSHITGFTKRKGMLAIHCEQDAPGAGEHIIYVDNLDNPIVAVIRQALHLDV